MISQLGNICLRDKQTADSMSVLFYLKLLKLTLSFAQLSNPSAPQKQQSIIHPLPFICALLLFLTSTHSLPHSSSTVAPTAPTVPSINPGTAAL